jgi:hypothetical protein|tara:strand:+ start:7317 stop:8429 length:1113 start_codon:yes stop_codon:yes gene_type:complete
MTGSKFFLTVIAVLFALSKTIKVQAQAVNIGDVSELNGSAQIVRDKTYNANLDFAIQSNDEAITTNGRMAITFLDESIVRLTEHSQLLIDEYIYDPDPSQSKMSLNFALGTARFISGNINLIDKQNIKLRTPTANIAIRGTDFTATVDELGRSLIILLPDSFGLSSGEIEVVTATGSVVLNKPYEATTVDVFENAPSKPVVLDLTLDVIDNMLIVSPPKKEDVIQEETSNTKTVSLLDFNDLDIDYLNEDFLDDNSLEFTELDINYLDVNFLEDLLKVLDALAIEEDEDQLSLATGVNISGTLIGQDTETQITTIVTGQTISLRRKISESVQVDLNSGGGYTVILIQDGVSNIIKINGGGDSTITIRQSS